MLGMDFLYGPIGITFLTGIISILLYWYATRNFDYWEKRNVPFMKPFPLFGSMFDYFRKPFHEVDMDNFQRFGRIYGYFEGSRPGLLIAEPKLLREILVKDFQFFPNRRYVLTGDKIFDNILFNVVGEDWKRIRTILTPAFSTGKLKRVMNIFKDCAQTVVENFKTASKNGAPVEVKRVYGAFTMDVIASAAFSTKIDSHNDPDNEFVVPARKLFRQGFSWRFLLVFLAPKAIRFFKISPVPPWIFNFFRDVILHIIEERKRTGQTRNDFLQLLMDTTKELKDELKEEEDETDDIASTYGSVDLSHQVFKSVTRNKSLSLDELVAQCIIFFIAGYDSTASLISFVTYELALNSDIQEKVHQELVDALEKSNGELTYDALQSMKYLDNIISEALRLYPPSIRVERMAEADYDLSDKGITVPKGMIIGIPIYTLHRDPELFLNPEKFDPDRFTTEEKAKRDPYAYLPFGAGPRNCVGMRFVLLEIKVCLAIMIANFKFSRCPQTKVPMEYMRSMGMLLPKDVTISIETRDDNPLVK